MKEGEAKVKKLCFATVLLNAGVFNKRGYLEYYTRVGNITVSIFLSDAVVVVLMRKILMKPLKVKVTSFLNLVGEVVAPLKVVSKYVP